MNAVEVRGLSKRFGPTRVLASIDLTVEHGEHAVVTGPNGSGKTTLLRVLCGVLRPTEGEVSVLGGAPDRTAVRRKIGVLAHTSALYPRMTAMENVRFWGRMYDDADAPSRGADILRTLGLDPDDARPLASYSQGMRQRVALTRALCTDPDVLVVDEPFAGLDSDGADAVAAMLGAHRTVIAATHDPERLGGSKRFALRDGRLLVA